MAIDKKASSGAREQPPETAPETVERQDQSIKARKNQLFEVAKPDDGISKLPFSVYLRDTPAASFSMEVKIGLWASAVIVALLFLAALVGFGR